MPDVIADTNSLHPVAQVVLAPVRSARAPSYVRLTAGSRHRVAVDQMLHKREFLLLAKPAEFPCQGTGGGRNFDRLAIPAIEARVSPHSIILSACTSNLSGITSPIALAAFTLTINSNLVGACTARSPGFSPLRMRLTYPAAARKSAR